MCQTVLIPNGVPHIIDALTVDRKRNLEFIVCREMNSVYLPSRLITQMIAEVLPQVLRFCIAIRMKHPSFLNISTPACHLSHVD